MKYSRFVLINAKWCSRFFRTFLGIIFIILVIGMIGGNVTIPNMLIFIGISAFLIILDIFVTKQVRKQFGESEDNNILK